MRTSARARRITRRASARRYRVRRPGSSRAHSAAWAPTRAEHVVPHAIRAPDSTQTPACRARPVSSAARRNAHAPARPSARPAVAPSARAPARAGEPSTRAGRSSAAARIIAFDSNGARPRGLNTASPQTIFSPDSAQRRAQRTRRRPALFRAARREPARSASRPNTRAPHTRIHPAPRIGQRFAGAHRGARATPYFSSTPT